MHSYEKSKTQFKPIKRLNLFGVSYLAKLDFETRWRLHIEEHVNKSFDEFGGFDEFDGFSLD
jgi:hypothetical protein